MNYPLYNLNDVEFEELVALICTEILGTGTITFSQGKDGGRDGKFTGTANSFPSSAKPWTGKFIIQAKHTTKPNSSCSDSDFTSILNEEIRSLIKLKKNNKVDCYLLFTNRKLTGLQDPKLEDLIECNVEVKNQIIGLETILRWLKEFPRIAKIAQLNKLMIPLDFYEEDIRETIIDFSNTDITPENIHDIKEKFLKIPIHEKNRLNLLSEEYFEDVLKKSYIYFSSIEEFLEDPLNIDYKEKYENTVSDIQEKITIKRNEFALFDEILAYLYDIILDNSSSKLLKSRKYIRTFLHYMYAICDIGKKVQDHVTT